MATVTTGWRRSFLRRALRQSQSLGMSLSDFLAAAEDAKIELSESGRQVIRVSANGVSTDFQIPGQNSPLSLQFVIDGISAMVDLYDRVHADLVAAGSAHTDTDTATAMLADDTMQRVTDFGQDYSLLRYGGGNLR